MFGTAVMGEPLTARAARVAAIRALPAESQALLAEVGEIVKSGQKDAAERESDCTRVREILALGAPGVGPDARYDFGQSLLCLSLHYDFGHPPQMLAVVMEAAAASERVFLKNLLNEPSNEVDGEHILDVVATLAALEVDPHMTEKGACLCAAGADLHAHESATETDRSRLSANSPKVRSPIRSPVRSPSGREYAAISPSRAG